MIASSLAGRLKLVEVSWGPFKIRCASSAAHAHEVAGADEADMDFPRSLRCDAKDARQYWILL